MSTDIVEKTKSLVSKMLGVLPDVMHHFESLLYHRKTKVETNKKIQATFELALNPETSDEGGKKAFCEFAHPGKTGCDCLLCLCKTKDGCMKTFYWIEPVDDDRLTDEQRTKIIARFSGDLSTAKKELEDLEAFILEFKEFSEENKLVSA